MCPPEDNPSFISAGYPRAAYSRDHIAKSYLNIKNIKNITSSNNPGLAGTTNELGSAIALGNYSHDYEILQMPDRAVNNRYLVENSGVSTSSVASTFISGLFDRTTPNRGQNKHIFASRFSAPGGPDTLGSAYLDAESESFSVYNALPFRNLSVRSPLRRFLANHSPFGGQSVAASTTITATMPQRQPDRLLSSPLMGHQQHLHRMPQQLMLLSFLAEEQNTGL